MTKMGWSKHSGNSRDTAQVGSKLITPDGRTQPVSMLPVAWSVPAGRRIDIMNLFILWNFYTC